MTKTNEAARLAARANLNASRRKMAAFVMAQTGAALDDMATIHDGCIVLSGDKHECALVALYFLGLGVAGVTVDEPMADDPDWTCVRIPEAGNDMSILLALCSILLAIAKAAKVRKTDLASLRASYQAERVSEIRSARRFELTRIIPDIVWVSA